jgi:hypothetical protein
VCDCAGQALYYFSHTLHFTRRCLYVLTWTAHKFSDSRAAQALHLDAIVSPLKTWLQLLAVNVPEACVIVVGTHCRVQPQQFEAMRQLVGEHVRDEIVRLHHMAQAESAATRQVLQRQETKARELLAQVQAEAAARQLQLAVALSDFVDAKAHVEALRPVARRGLMRKAEMLLKAAREWAQTKARLCRLLRFDRCTTKACPRYSSRTTCPLAVFAALSATVSVGHPQPLVTYRMRNPREFFMCLFSDSADPH